MPVASVRFLSFHGFPPFIHRFRSVFPPFSTVFHRFHHNSLFKFKKYFEQHCSLESSSMPRRFVTDLGQQENIDQIFLASQKQLRPNRNGNLYLQVDLADRTGTICARMWNAGENDYRSFEDGDLVRVEGATQIYQGGLQLI